jgi:hypothetical protein
MSIKFQNQIDSGKLIVVNSIIREFRSEVEGLMPFYIHKTRSVISTLVKPPGKTLHEYEVVYIDSCAPGQLIRSNVAPTDKVLYIKIDLEGYDSKVLNSLALEEIDFDYLSLEAHDLSSLFSALNHPAVTGLKLFPQKEITSLYSKHKIENFNGSLIEWEFKDHSSGPFGVDLVGDFYTKEAFVELFLISKPGWKDIHVTTLSQNINANLPLSLVILGGLKRYIITIYANQFSYAFRSKIHKLRSKFLRFL